MNTYMQWRYEYLAIFRCDVFDCFILENPLQFGHLSFFRELYRPVVRWNANVSMVYGIVVATRVGGYAVAILGGFGRLARSWKRRMGFLISARLRVEVFTEQKPNYYAVFSALHAN